MRNIVLKVSIYVLLLAAGCLVGSYTGIFLSLRQSKSSLKSVEEKAPELQSDYLAAKNWICEKVKLSNPGPKLFKAEPFDGNLIVYSIDYDKKGFSFAVLNAGINVIGSRVMRFSSCLEKL